MKKSSDHHIIRLAPGNLIVVSALVCLLGGYAVARAQPADVSPTPNTDMHPGSVDQASSTDDAPASTENAEADEAGATPRMVSVSFRDTELQQIASFLMRELRKPVLVHDQIRDTRLTIMSERELPLPQALELIGNALRQRGVIIVEGPRQVELLPLTQVRQVNRPTVGPDASAADVVDQSAIVDKVFAVEHYDVNRLKDLVLPMLPEYAFLTADPNLRRIVVTAAAGDLLHIERLIEQLDVPRANDTVQRIIPVEHGDASEIVTLVRTIIAGTMSGQGRDIFTSTPVAPSAQQGNNPQRGGRGNRSQPMPGNPAGGTSSSTPNNTAIVERSDAPVMIQADLSRNWIIAAAAPDVMEQIERWVKELDQPKDRSEPYELFDIQHADVEELATQINEAINAMPDADIRNSVRVIPFVKSRQILVYGSQRGRGLVQALLKQLDVESSQYQLIEEIALRHDTAANVKAKIEELFAQTDSGSTRSRWWGGFGRGESTSQTLTVTADVQRNTVTVMTDPLRMRRIKELVGEQWDVPINLDEVKPRVYELRYTDPVQVRTLLEAMFTRSRTTTSFNWWSDTQTTVSNNPVGRLFGEFSFNAMQDSNKLIVSTKNAANYTVIDDLIAEIDQPQDAGVPVILELKHANAEDVAEQLNAMFAEPGTPSAITRNARGLSEAIRQTSTGSQRGAANTTNNQNNNANNQNRNNTPNQQNDPSQMNFWWSQSRPNINEQPTSNLIGKPRVVPINRRNALMIIAPNAHLDPLRQLIAELDKPGSQVVIHAIITEIQHNDESTLGVRIASDPSIFNDSRLADQSIGGGVNADYARSIFNGDGILNANLDLNILIQMLVKNLNLKILNEPRVYTSDNQEAHFFDGQDVPVITSDLTRGDSQGNITRSFEYESVGTRLHVRPHITQEGEVDLEVNLELSRIVNGSSVFGNFIFDRRTTTTQVTLKDGQTIVISGIVEQEDFDEVRKLPLLGDLPLLGGLFRATDRVARNREVVAFITPHIVRMGAESDEMTARNEEWLQRIRDAIQVPEGGEAVTPPPTSTDELDPAAASSPSSVAPAIEEVDAE